MRRREFVLSATVLPFTLSARVQAQQPEIPTNIRQFWEKLAKARTLTFLAQTWDWEQPAEVAPRPYKHLRQTFEVKIQRPNRIAIWGSPPQEYVIPADKNTGINFRWSGSSSYVQIFDGQRNLLLDPLRRAYRYGKPLPALNEPVGDPDDPVHHLRFDFLFDKTPMQDFSLLPPDAPRNDDFGPIYRMPGADPKQPSEVRMVFDPYTGHLDTLAEWWQTDKEKLEETMRLTFRHWGFDPPLPRSTFDTRIPRGYKTMDELLKEQKARRPNAEK